MEAAKEVNMMGFSERKFKRPFGEWWVRKHTDEGVSYVPSGYAPRGTVRWLFYIMRFHAKTKDRSHPRNWYIYLVPVSVGRLVGSKVQLLKTHYEVQIWRTTSFKTGATFIMRTKHRTKGAARKRMNRLQKSLYHHYKTSNRAEWKPPKG
jgi:hypothetical protein